MATNTLGATIKLFHSPPNSPPLKYISLQRSEKENCVEGLTELQMDDIHSSSLVLSQKDSRLVKQDSPLVNPYYGLGCFLLD